MCLFRKIFKRIDDLDLDVYVHTQLSIGKLVIKARKKYDIPESIPLIQCMKSIYICFEVFVKYWKAPLMRIVKSKMRKFITNSGCNNCSF